MTATYRYSEIFKSIQGEGVHTGIPSIFLRLWGCNFRCDGLSNPGGEPPPTDADEALSLNNLPVFTQGCDSRYSWSKEYLHLSIRDTAENLCDLIVRESDGGFSDSITGPRCHLIFTGGEPMLAQNALTAILQAFWDHPDPPRFVTVESNGTQPLTGALQDIIRNRYADDNGEWLWSVSPKLGISGEAWHDAIKPDVVAGYAAASNAGQLKFVVDGGDACWDELETAARLYRNAGIDWKVWIMPVGATAAQQEDIQEQVCRETLRRGYNFCPRVHSWIFGNKIGT